MTALVYTVTETLRYRGAIGQWSWVLHRITGLGVLFFLVLHVIDTSWASFFPLQYEEAIKIYQTPLFTVGEFGLVAAVVYHALNGIRIAIFDYRPAWWKHQRKAAVYVLIATVIILVPTFIGMFSHVLNHYASNPDFLPLDVVLGAQLPFIAGMGLAVIAALLLSALAGLVIGDRSGTKSLRPSPMEKFWWRFMRLSGVLVLPLVFGHLAMVHVIQGVFDITAAEFTVVGTDIVNASGAATEFVAARWNYAVAGVFIWRLYDIALLALAVLHGFNGLRYVLTDYAANATVKRAMVILCAIGTVVLIVVGGAALLNGVDETAVAMAQQALENTAGH